MTLAIQGPITRDPGPITLAKRWPHDPGENVGRWPHVPGDRHVRVRPSVRRRRHGRVTLLFLAHPDVSNCSSPGRVGEQSGAGTGSSRREICLSHRSNQRACRVRGAPRKNRLSRRPRNLGVGIGSEASFSHEGSTSWSCDRLGLTRNRHDICLERACSVLGSRGTGSSMPPNPRFMEFPRETSAAVRVPGHRGFEAATAG